MDDEHKNGNEENFLERLSRDISEVSEYSRPSDADYPTDEEQQEDDGSSSNSSDPNRFRRRSRGEDRVDESNEGGNPSEPRLNKDKSDEFIDRRPNEQNRFKNDKLNSNPNSPNNPTSPGDLSRNKMPNQRLGGPNPGVPNAGGEVAKDAASGIGEAAKDAALSSGEVAKDAALGAGGELAKDAALGAGGASTVGAAGVGGAAAEAAKDAGIAGATTAAGTTAAATTAVGSTAAATTTVAGTTAVEGSAAVGGTVVGGGGLAALLSNPPGMVALGVMVGIAVVCIVVAIALVIIVFAAVYTNSLTDIKLQNGYALIDAGYCEHVTVYDSNADGTYPYETYIAGVVTAEVGMFNNDTVNKVFAVAARNYFYNNNKNCTIAGNATKQAFSKPTAAALSAAKATEGIIMLSNGKIPTAMYDAFAYKSEDGNNYYLKQKNQAISKSWFRSHYKTEEAFNSALKFYKSANHGKGMSQWGALYLAENGKNFEEILKFYYDDIQIARQASALAYNPNVHVTNAPANRKLTKSFDQFLSEQGSSISSYNQAIFKAVNEAGYGTRAGVVAAGYSLISLLDDNYGLRFPYANGGHSFKLGSKFDNWQNPLGADPGWGSYNKDGWCVNVCSEHYGMDCTGFVTWALYNGGYKYYHVIHNKETLAKDLGVTYCHASDSDCNGQAGDLLVSNGHAVLIVGFTNTSYIIAQASSPSEGMKVNAMGKRNSSYYVIKMDNFYKNWPRR
ncbi:MAG: hypothetical protein J5892_02620 [Bacilli bacterium]|nr:hypothetical protein [Bacilli bacterium]